MSYPAPRDSDFGSRGVCVVRMKSTRGRGSLAPAAAQTPPNSATSKLALQTCMRGLTEAFPRIEFPMFTALLVVVPLLILSNLFMTYAWYGHLKDLAAQPWYVAARTTEDSAGSHHPGGFCAVFIDLYESAAELEFLVGRLVHVRRGVLCVSILISEGCVRRDLDGIHPAALLPVDFVFDDKPLDSTRYSVPQAKSGVGPAAQITGRDVDPRHSHPLNSCDGFGSQQRHQ